MKYKAPIEYQVLNIQQIEHRTGWEQGKRESLQWAVNILKDHGYPDAADFLEGISFGEAVSRIKQATRFQPSQHEKSNQAQKVQAPNTSVVWPGEKPSSSNAGYNGS